MSRNGQPNIYYLGLEEQESRETSVDSTYTFLDECFNGDSLFSPRVHHSGATVIQIPEEVENTNVIEIPLTPLTPTNGFDFDSYQETVIPKINESSRPHVQNMFRRCDPKRSKYVQKI